mgnify:CR=1 FL=1
MKIKSVNIKRVKMESVKMKSVKMKSEKIKSVKIKEIWEDYNTFMSIIESVRLNDLIVYEDVNLSYMYALCDKWCITNPVLIEKLN